MTPQHQEHVPRTASSPFCSETLPPVNASTRTLLSRTRASLCPFLTGSPPSTAPGAALAPGGQEVVLSPAGASKLW